MSILNAAYFNDEEAAFSKLESVLWPSGTVCPHCGVVGTGVKIKANPTEKVRFGLWKCADCKKQFTVTVKTIFESSHIPLHKWLQAVALMASSKKGISAHQLHRTLGITYKSAWFMAHRVREAMAEGALNPFGQGGGAVEADETFLWTKKGHQKGKKATGYEHKRTVLTLIDRETRQARSVVVETLRPHTVAPILRANLAKEARLMTDEAGHYLHIGKEFAAHETVAHSRDEYVRGEAYTNTAEGYFSIFKRGMRGVYQHCGEQHLHRYVAEFDFRYNHRVANGVNDVARTDRALRGAVGKRLKYADSSRALG